MASRATVTSRAFAATAFLLATVVSSLIGCSRGSIRDGHRLALEAELRALEAYASVGPGRSLADFDETLVVIREELVQELIAAVLPLEATVGDLRLRVDSAAVEFRPGLAVLRLATRVSPARAASLSADVRLLGALEIGPFPEDGEALTARVRMFGLDTRDVRLGALTPPAERLVDELARLRADELNDLLDTIQIPVRLVEVVKVPTLELDEVTIPGAELPVRFELASVRVLEAGIFVSFRIDREQWSVPIWPGGGHSSEGDGP